MPLDSIKEASSLKPQSPQKSTIMFRLLLMELKMVKITGWEEPFSAHLGEYLDFSK